jgi:ligand-binding SRPBCC domain-containing protein
VGQIDATDLVETFRLEREQHVARPLREVFLFFSRAQNLERITPPWLRFRLVGAPDGDLAAGTLIEYRLRLHRIPLRWVSQIDRWEENRRFVDRQVRGPYRLWLHEHEFSGLGDGTLVRDRVRYALPLGPLGGIAARLVRRDLDAIFDYRRAAVTRLLG